MSEEEHDFDKAHQGAIVPPLSNKTRVTIRLDTDIVDWFRQQVHDAGGGNYQTLMNEALREYVQRKQKEER